MEAHALICGESWVYQRIGKLSQALELAQQSLDLGEAVGWLRNDAFCYKCIGRIQRMQAERIQDANEKARLLDRSAYSINRAIDLFSILSGFGEHSVEVGECHSLLGRTLLEGGDLEAADFHVAEALSRIQRDDSKQDIDLQILRGDLEAARGDQKTAF